MTAPKDDSPKVRRAREIVRGNGAPESPAVIATLAPEDGLPDAVCLSDVADVAPVEWIFPGLLPRGEPALIAGPDGEMKTTITLYLACAVAAGGAFLSYAASVSGPVLIISGEDSKEIVRNRCAAIARGHGWQPERVLAQLHFVDADGADLTQPRWRVHLVRQAERIRPLLVVLDPLANLVGGDENGARPEVRRLWRALTKPSRASVVLVHHAGKKGDGSRSKGDRIRGHTDIRSGSRATFFVERDASGIVIENVKQSRADKVKPFVVEPFIQSDPKNRGNWQLARFEKQTVREAVRSHVESWLLEFLLEYPGTTTTQTRDAAGKAGFGIVDLARAQRELADAGLITFDAGKNNARFWRLAAPNDKPVGQAEQACELSLFEPVDRLANRLETTGAKPVRPPLGGTGSRAESEPVQTGLADVDEYDADERAALEDGL